MRLVQLLNRVSIFACLLAAGTKPNQLEYVGLQLKDKDRDRFRCTVGDRTLLLLLRHPQIAFPGF